MFGIRVFDPQTHNIKKAQTTKQIYLYTIVISKLGIYRDADLWGLLSSNQATQLGPTLWEIVSEIRTAPEKLHPSLTFGYTHTSTSKKIKKKEKELSLW